MTVTAARAAGRQVARLASLSLVTHDIERLAEFYRRAFGCILAGSARLEAHEVARLLGVRTGARRAVLTLGAQCIELLQFDTPGQAYPVDVAGSDLRFQHFAIVVADMPRAYEHLGRTGGWVSISTHGPQPLPASSGGVTAFKFRDPEGHPLELLEFATASADAVPAATQSSLFSGIDHSAICVSDSARSIGFYAALGLRVSSRTLNQGPEQQQLDGLADAQVQVIGLSPPRTPPHLELLCYRGAAIDARAAGRAAAIRPNDVAATRLVFEGLVRSAQPLTLRDPDGHHLTLY